MVNIVINDLDNNKELDKKAMDKLVGGRKSGNGLQTKAWNSKKITLLTSINSRTRIA